MVVLFFRGMISIIICYLYGSFFLEMEWGLVGNFCRYLFIFVSFLQGILFYSYLTIEL